MPLGGVVTPPPFPIDVYPGWLAAMVDGVARFTQTDPAMAGTVALAVLSACAGGRLEVEPIRGWREPVNLYLAVIADPGEMKSPVHGALTAPLERVQAELTERVIPLREEHAAMKDIAERQAEHAKTLAAKADPAKQAEAATEAVAAALAAQSITVRTQHPNPQHRAPPQGSPVTDTAPGRRGVAFRATRRCVSALTEAYRRAL